MHSLQIVRDELNILPFSFISIHWLLKNQVILGEKNILLSIIAMN
jgi:hypothetical protein